MSRTMQPTNAEGEVAIADQGAVSHEDSGQVLNVPHT